MRIASIRLALAEEEVQAIVAHGLDDIFYVLTLQSRLRELLILLVESVKHHPAHSFLILIYMIHQHFQVDWRCYVLLHTIRDKDVKIKEYLLKVMV